MYLLDDTTAGQAILKYRRCNILLMPDGFTIGTSSGENSNNVILKLAWSWKANGQGSSNTQMEL